MAENHFSMRTVYFDEAGGTGSNLLDDNQPHFLYGGVLISEVEAQSIVDQIRSDHHIQSPELKGRQIAKRADGAEIARAIFSACAERTYLFAADKKAAFAGKLFDYTIEPVLHRSGTKSLFYKMSAHRYFLNYFYMAWQLGPENVKRTAEKVANEFQEAIRDQSLKAAPILFEHGEAEDGMLDDFLWFCRTYSEEIASEFKDVEEDDAVSRWILELTNTALYAILRQMEMPPNSLEVIYDESKPIDDFKAVLRSQLTEDDALSHVTDYVAGRSVHKAGIQLADVIVSTTAHALKNPSASGSDEVMELAEPALVWGVQFDEREIVPGTGTDGMLAYEALMHTLKRGGTPCDAVGMIASHTNHG